jgi:hypothetical protein
MIYEIVAKAKEKNGVISRKGFFRTEAQNKIKRKQKPLLSISLFLCSAFFSFSLVAKKIARDTS